MAEEKRHRKAKVLGRVGPGMATPAVTGYGSGSFPTGEEETREADRQATRAHANAVSSR